MYGHRDTELIQLGGSYYGHRDTELIQLGGSYCLDFWDTLLHMHDLLIVTIVGSLLQVLFTFRRSGIDFTKH